MGSRAGSARRGHEQEQGGHTLDRSDLLPVSPLDGKHHKVLEQQGARVRCGQLVDQCPEEVRGYGSTLGLAPENQRGGRCVPVWCRVDQLTSPRDQSLCCLGRDPLDDTNALRVEAAGYKVTKEPGLALLPRLDAAGSIGARRLWVGGLGKPTRDTLRLVIPRPADKGRAHE